MNYSYSQLSSPGGRSCNEDSIIIENIGNALVIVAADGLGGIGGGDIASRTAIYAIINFIKTSTECSENNIGSAINKASDAVLNIQTKTEKMKTTIVLLCIQHEKAICGHLGDSRLYQFRNGNIVFQTQDHSVSQMAVSVGEIKPEEIRGHDDRNKLLRALGMKERMPAETKELKVQKGDAFLLCTDGFWELVLENEMTDDLINSKDAERWLKKMCRRVESRLTDKSDNYSAIAVIIN